MVFNNWRMTHTEKLSVSTYSESSFKKILFYTDLYGGSSYKRHKLFTKSMLNDI